MMPDIDAKLANLSLKCRRPVSHLLAGEYRSVFRGQGIEFEDVRPYQPGDDVRNMDWQVTARTGEPHIKRYIEEREQFLYLMVDVSASVLNEGGDAMGLRRQTVAELCSLLAMSANQNNDRVSLILFTDQVELLIPPGKGRSHLMRIMDALLTFKPMHQKTSFASVLSRFGHLARKHSVAFIVSDYFVDDYLDEMRALAMRHDINAVHLIDPRARLSVENELVRFEDAESGKRRILDFKSSPSRTTESHDAKLRDHMLACGIDLMEIAASEDCTQALTKFFHLRQRRVLDETRG